MESKRGSFTSKENFHLTLKFIREVKISDIEKIEGCIDRASLNQRSFQLKLDKIGQFLRGNKSVV
ncbi:2'-5' RNA ligase family protein [Gottschalkia acidurici]|uniref:2'-5' RNA ligase family protein n=1 Tax=Clostridium acidurici TaxID=1556 RepID=UPI000311821D|nr:2'-5' RNA ligase family protein [Gottschalkia acidurici]